MQDKKKIVASNKICWELVPLQKSGTFYRYWGGVGCKNKCSFCFTTHTNKHQENSKKRKEYFAKRYNAQISENFSNQKFAYKSGSILLTDFIKQPRKSFRNNAILKMGLEFPTEKTRRENGKYFSDLQLKTAIQKAINFDKVNITGFLINGLNTENDWENFYYFMSKININSSKRFVFLKITNLEYQMFTPLFKTPLFFQKLFLKYLQNAPVKFKTIGTKYTAFALYQMCLNAIQNINDYNSLSKHKNNKDFDFMFNLYQKEYIDVDYSDTIDFNLV